MYSDLNTREPFYQGDILEDTPFFVIPKGFSELRQPTVQNQNVMILTQTCDIENRDFLILGRVVSFQELQETGVNENFLRNLRDRKIKYWFYLPADGTLQESYVDFTQMIYTPKRILRKRKRVKSLSDLGRHWLSYQISDYFGRPFSR